MQFLLKSFTLILLSTSLLVAQGKTVTLSGYVSDRASGEALIGANIVVEGKSIGSSTNQYGFYSLSLQAGAYRINASYLGYQTTSIDINLTAARKLDIELQSISVQGEIVEVTAESADQNVQSMEIGVEKLDVQIIKQVPVVLGEVDVLKTIQLLPGVSQVAEGSAGFNVRGGSADQNLVLLDEAPVYNASHLFGFFSVFNNDATKDVKLYKSGIPAQYGGRLSSVLDVRQKEGNSKKFAVSSGIGLISSRLLLEGPIGQNKGSIMLAGRRSYADVFLKLAGNNNTAFFYDLNFKTNYQLSDNDRLYASGYLGRDRFEIADILGTSWGNSAFTLRWNHLFSDRLFSNFTAIYSNYDYSLDLLASGSEYNWKSNIINTHLKADAAFFINNTYRLEFGGGSIFYNFQPGSIKPLQNSGVIPTSLDEKFGVESAGYLSLEQKLSDRLSFTYGLRFSNFMRLGDQTLRQYENDAPVVFDPITQRYEGGRVIGEEAFSKNERIASFNGLEPRFAARVLVDQSSSIKLGYNRTRQYIHLISNTSSPTPLDIWAPSGSFIEPQISDQIAAGYFRNFANDRFETSIEGYYKDMQNQLDYIDGADLTVNNYLETELLSGRGRAYGAELSIRKKQGKLTGWLSYTLSRSERQVKGIADADPGINNGEYYPSNFDRLHDLSLTAIYQRSRRVGFSGNFIFSTGRPVSYPGGRYRFSNLIIPQFEDRNQNRLPAYHRLDLAININEFWGGDWTFGIYNLYNRQNASSIRFRQKEDQPLTSEAVRLSFFGIVPSITYNISF
ncbi:MAG: TonB-dependent receptor [Calditrichia bacterium]